MINRIALLVITTLGFCACKKHEPEATGKPFSNVVILGNSITLAGPNPSIGWNGNWGMAASVADSDYVHLLTRHFKSENAACKVSAMNIAAFEREFNTFPLKDSLQRYRDTKPDLVIIRIGENVAADADTTAFSAQYAKLVNYFKAADPSVKILGVGSFWLGKDAFDRAMKQYSPFISLSNLGTDMSNYAWGQYADPAVQQHRATKGCVL